MSEHYNPYIDGYYRCGDENLEGVILRKEQIKDAKEDDQSYIDRLLSFRPKIQPQRKVESRKSWERRLDKHLETIEA